MFPTPPLNDAARAEIGRLYQALMSSYQEHSTIKHRAESQYQEFDWVRAKPAVDAIDVFLAQHFALTPEQLDFLINYDIKIRVGTTEEVIND